MVSKLRSRLALTVCLAGVVFSGASFVLPAVKTHQTAIGTGPTSPYGDLSTTISGYYIPPVDVGQTITVVITGYTPKSLTFSMFPSSGGDLSPTGPPIVFDSNFSAPVKRYSIISPATQAYGIFVTSSNRTQFVIAVDGVWSPYSNLTEYVSEGLFAAVGGFLAFYYFRHWEARRNLEERAELEAKAGKPKNGT